MDAEGQRAHGVTPGLSRDYVHRTAVHQAAFVLPHLRPGLRLLDVGCGPGTITAGLAEAVAPGAVIGLDHDARHVEAATALASERDLANATFQEGDALALSFEGESFDVAFENNLLVHLSSDAVDAAREAFRVLRPGGLFAARDTAGMVRGDSPEVREALTTFDRLFEAWQRSRGSDITLGARLPAILREAGFSEISTSISADMKSTPDEVREHARIMAFMLEGPMGRDALANGWADADTLAQLAEPIRAWGEDADAFFANLHVEVIGWKADATA